MKCFLVLLLILPAELLAQSGDTLRLDQLVLEALRNNPMLRAAEYNRDALEARTMQVGSLDDPTLLYMREEMPGFHWSEAMYSRIELMQMFRFPGKLSTRQEISEIDAEHAHHELMENVNDILVSLRSAYYELWFAQQALLLNKENKNLLRQFAAIAQTRYGVGDAPQQDVLKSYVEIARLENQAAVFRQQGLSAKTMLIALLNRSLEDTLGVAVVDRKIAPLPPLDTLRSLALQFRPMLWHDSLSVEGNRKALSLAEKAFLPDFTIGLEYVTTPNSDFTGWSLKAGITLPFAPWTLGKANAGVEEASILIAQAEETLNNSRNMVLSNVNDLYFKAQSFKEQLVSYSNSIIPQSRQALQASLMAYQTGRVDFLMLIDSHRMLVELSMDELMLRMQFEQTIAELKRAIGYAGIFDTWKEGK